MGQTGFCKKTSAVFCEHLRFPAFFCKKSAPPKCYNSQEASENLQKSAKMCARKTANLAPFVRFSPCLLVPLE